MSHSEVICRLRLLKVLEESFLIRFVCKIILGPKAVVSGTDIPETNGLHSEQQAIDSSIASKQNYNSDLPNSQERFQRVNL